MDIFLNQKVEIYTCFGGVDGSYSYYKGIVTSFNEEYLCLDNNKYVARKYIMMIKII